MASATPYDDDDADDTDQGQQSNSNHKRPQMLAWISRNLEHDYPICADDAEQRGLMHRLDVETSGLLLCAKSYVGAYWLRLQWHADAIDKEYVCVVRGWVDPSLREIQKPIRVDKFINEDSQQGFSRSVISSAGKASKSEIITLAHLVKPESGQEVWSEFETKTTESTVVQEHQADENCYSLVAVKLHTGRTHQIRVHMMSIGHPLVCDSKYSAGCFPAEHRWCLRNFLHTHRLGFDDVSDDGIVRGGRADIVCPLPEDLRDALGQLRPVGTKSARFHADWLSGEAKRICEFEAYAKEEHGA